MLFKVRLKTPKLQLVLFYEMLSCAGFINYKVNYVKWLRFRLKYSSNKHITCESNEYLPGHLVDGIVCQRHFLTQMTDEDIPKGY